MMKFGLFSAGAANPAGTFEGDFMLMKDNFVAI
jgi:hypothetical protein